MTYYLTVTTQPDGMLHVKRYQGKSYIQDLCIKLSRGYSKSALTKLLEAFRATGVHST